jgi:hypothetical protein
LQSWKCCYAGAFHNFLRGGGVFFLTKSNAASDTTAREKVSVSSRWTSLSLSFLFTSLITLSARLCISFLFLALPLAAATAAMGEQFLLLSHSPLFLWCSAAVAAAR